jgi:hypothetical protein
VCSFCGTAVTVRMATKGRDSVCTGKRLHLEADPYLSFPGGENRTGGVRVAQWGSHRAQSV